MNNHLINHSAIELHSKKYAYLPQLFHFDQEREAQNWKRFQESWHTLEMDHYMGDKGKYRFRRYGVFSWNNQDQCFILENHQPHYQDYYYNNLNGGIKRYFAPIKQDTVTNPCFKKILDYCATVFNSLKPDTDWHIEVHQFRIIIDDKNMGFPTPEGVHRDGRKYILMTLINKVNVLGGVTTVYDSDKNKLTQVTLEQPTDTLLVHDEDTMHSVTAIKKIDNHENAYRDVLVVTFIEKDKMKHA